MKRTKIRRVAMVASGLISLLTLMWVGMGTGGVASAHECADGVSGCLPYSTTDIQNSADQQKILSMAHKLTTDNGPAEVYFADYGHFVPNPILHYWRANGGTSSFGGPLSASFMDNQGNVVQFFQKTALAYYPAQAGSSQAVHSYPLGSLYLAMQPTTLQQVAPFATVPALPASIKNQKYFPQTGHKISFGMLDYFNTTGGLNKWGLPLSEEYTITGSDGKTYNAQLFEQGRILWSVATGVIADSNFLQTVTNASQINTAPETNLDPNSGKAIAPNYSSSLWSHWVDVSLTQQRETFYEGDIAVRTNLVTTGTTRNPTPVGNFHIFRLVANEHMKNGKPGDVDYYDLSNVLYTMYFTYDGDALHYAWWRSVFGEVGSHGCVNEDLDTSLFAWNFLKLGSLVKVHN